MRSSGALLREARRRAGLTQVELATRAGVTQSVISAYEADRRQPALSTLAALVEATGFDLEVALAPADARLARLTGPWGRRIRQRREDLVALAAARGVHDLAVFGSVARGEERDDSDVDLLVTLPPTMGLFDLGRLRSELEHVLEGAQVDLVPRQGLRAEVRDDVEADLVRL